MYALWLIFTESWGQAIGQLLANKLRTFLSLLGITIGIWCVVSVLSAVDSLAANIKNSFQKLGNDVVYMSIYPWGPMDDEQFERFSRRPFPNEDDLRAIQRRVPTADCASYTNFLGLKNIEYRSAMVSNVFVVAPTFDYARIFNIQWGDGRYFTPFEYEQGSNKCVLGNATAQKLFGEGIDPIGKEVKVLGRKLVVVGVIKKEGKSLINPVNFDDAVIIPFSFAKKIYNFENIRGASINVKAKAGVKLEELKDNLSWVVRATRRQKPREEDSFSLNQLSLITDAIDQVFAVVNVAGWIIGLFSLLVGCFGVANIMFVSVKERTNLIGIKKAIGATRVAILIEFLIEAVLLCLMGGALGLFLVWLATYLASAIFDYTIFLSLKNMFIGVGTSMMMGVLAGIIPAWQAAKLDPVEAIRA